MGSTTDAALIRRVYNFERYQHLSLMKQFDDPHGQRAGNFYTDKLLRKMKD